MSSKTTKRGLPEVTRQPKGKQEPGIIIDTECSEYAMIFPRNPNPPQKKARKTKSAKSKTPVPPEVELPKIVTMDHASPAPVSHPLTSTPPPAQSVFVFTSKDVGNDIKRPTRKRLVDKVEITSENIPPKAVLRINKDKPKAKRAPGITIDTECSEYAMKFPRNPNRPQKKARRGRSAKSKTPVPSEVEPSKTVKMDHALPAPVSHTLTLTPTTSSRHGSFTRKKSEALGILNKIEKPSNSNDVGHEIKRPKRKRLVDEVEIAAENIPLEAVLPVLQFGINKDICPRKRRKLQGLMAPRT